VNNKAKFLKKWFNWNFAVFFMIKAAPGIEKI
jgi:hypothetical protein